MTADDTQLHAGAAEIDITPPVGTQLAGNIGRVRPVEEIADPIHARVLVLRQGEQMACIVSLELLAVADDEADTIRRRAEEKYGIPAANVMVHTVQNHAAPMLGARTYEDLCDWLPEDSTWLINDAGEYVEQGIAGTLDAIRLAKERLEPVHAFAGRDMNDRVAFNRRILMRDGHTETHPSSELMDQALCREGPVDPEVAVVHFMNDDGRSIAALLHHTCHPVHGVGGRTVTAGWPGFWVAEANTLLGDDCVCMVINGFCGNIHHRDHFNRDHVDDPERIGAILGDTTKFILEHTDRIETGPLRCISETIKIPHRKIPDERLQEARDLLEQHPEPMWLDEEKTRVDWEWCYATSVLDVHGLRERQPERDYEVQGIRVGDLALLAVPGEPFVQGQLELKLQSPAPYLFPAHMSNGYVGYLPTREAFERGGYETNTALWSRFDESALERMVEKADEIIRRLYE